MVTEKRFNEGELILRQGEAGDHVCQVRSGEVEIFIEHYGDRLVLGTVGTGEFLGEMSVIGGLATRSASARAKGNVTVEVLDREAFMRLVSQDVTLAYQVLERLSERLRTSNERLAQSVTPAMLPGEGGPRVTLSAGGREIESRLPAGGLTITQFPFTVGRQTTSVNRVALLPDLAIADSQPFRLSRRHFAIIVSDGRPNVLDLGSTLGTEVNGRAIGEHFGRDREYLSRGENIVVAGGHQSPFVFKLEVD